MNEIHFNHIAAINDYEIKIHNFFQILRVNLSEMYLFVFKCVACTLTPYTPSYSVAYPCSLKHSRPTNLPFLNILLHIIPTKTDCHKIA
jgi:hypothetical protein